MVKYYTATYEGSARLVELFNVLMLPNKDYVIRVIGDGFSPNYYRCMIYNPYDGKYLGSVGYKTKDDMAKEWTIISKV